MRGCRFIGRNGTQNAYRFRKTSTRFILSVPSQFGLLMDEDDFISHAGFYPLKPLQGKRNHKVTYRIAPDGSVMQAVSLAVNDKFHREQIVCVHFLSSLVRWVLREDIGVTFTSRDKPWDFGILLSNADQFNVEIVAIAEDQTAFMRRKKEGGLRSVSARPTLPLSLVRKLNREIDSERAQEVIADADARHLPDTAVVDNPWQTEGPILFVENAPDPQSTLCALVRDAIIKKARKRHAGKESTILIVDNLTTAFDLWDFHAAAKRFDELRPICPFKEVWFYTGYYSDDDGNNAEWSLCPILETNQTKDARAAAMKQLGVKPNQAGIIHGGFK
jgi:hypothetical protein